MRILRFIFFLTTAGILAACGSNQQPATAAMADSTLTQPLYPFPQYLANELAYLDSMPLVVERTVRENGVTVDSGMMDKASFKQAIAFFTSIDPNTKALRPKYEESSFNDLSIEALTFSISATDASLPLQQADVLLHPSTQQVKSVALQLQQQSPDSSITTRVLWKHHMKCQLAQTIAYTDGRSINRITEFVWDKPL